MCVELHNANEASAQSRARRVVFRHPIRGPMVLVSVHGVKVGAPQTVAMP